MKRSVQAGWVLRQFLADPSQPQYGYGLMEATRLPSGSVYVLLARFLRDGWLTQGTENGDGPRTDGRPPRRNYMLTAEGERAAREYVAALDAIQLRRGRVSL